MRYGYLCFVVSLLMSVNSFAVQDSEMNLPPAVHLPVPHIFQPDNQTCLPTSLDMALHWYGRADLTTDTIQALQKRTWYDRYNVPAIARDYGLYALPSWEELGWKKIDIKRELASGHPVIMGVNTGRGGHFVLAVGYTVDDKLIINDPTRMRADYLLGGVGHAVEWTDMLWRNGVMIRPEPFDAQPRPISGMAITTTAPVVLRPGEIAKYEVSVRNNGSQPWPVNMRLCAINPFGDGGWLKSKSDLFDRNTWKSQSCAAEVPTTAPLVQPGEVYTFSFNVKAPQVDKAMTIHERFGLVDGSGRWFFEDYQAGPGPWSIADMIVIAPNTSDTLPIASNNVPWKTKYGTPVEEASTTASVPTPPKGGKLMYLPPGKELYNSAWVGNMNWKDYRVSCWVWFDYDGENYKTDGFTRVGVFARDNGMHSPCRKNLTELGVAIVTGYDSDDGALRFGDSDNGYIGDGIGDVIPKKGRQYLKKSGWHKIVMECRGDEIKYYMDEELRRTDKANEKFAVGDCGLFVDSFRTKEPRGLYFSDFSVEPLD
ncbi:hypothetical protein GX645_04920 [Candidatus Sumerlaeota bacterium]|nr:hypothetical protein [Candidatus Sumerlaeota bacterium]